MHYRRKIGRPLCGDRIIVDQRSEPPAVQAILPASARFARGDKRGRPQWIAANTEQAAVIVAPAPAPSRDLLDRYLVAAELLRVKPLLILHKVDLGEHALKELRLRLQRYLDLGYQCLEVSAHSGVGMPQLRHCLRAQRTLFTGQSGVGKSSLISALIPDLQLQTRALSQATGKGTHTTSTACMYYLPGTAAAVAAGSVIDTPGVWEYSLWQMTATELASGFREFQPWLGQCRFRDCRHIDTPGCAIFAASAAGQIAAARYQCYQRLLAEQSRFMPSS